MRRIAIFLASLALAGVAAAEDTSVRLGGDIEISDSVNGQLKAIGGRISVDAPVAGDVSLAGGSIEVNAAVDGNVRVAGGHVTINAPVEGDASVAAGTLELGPLARIGGKLSFHGEDLKRDPAATVNGPIERASSGRWHRHRHDDRDDFTDYTHGWFWTSGLLVLAALIAAALPGPSARMAQELRERPWLTTLVGFVALVTIPVAAVLAMVTVIGIPLGLLAIAAYAVLLLVGYVWLAVVIGGLLLDRVKPETAALTAWRAGAAVVAMLALALLTRLPFVGGIFVFAALVVGAGMIVAAVVQRAKPAEGISAAA